MMAIVRSPRHIAPTILAAVFSISIGLCPPVIAQEAPAQAPTLKGQPGTPASPAFEIVEERRGPFVLRNQSFNAVLHYHRLPGQTGPDAQILESFDLLDASGTLQYHQAFSTALENGSFVEDCSISVQELHGTNGEGLLLDTGCLPSAPMSGGPWQILGVSNAKLVPIGKPIVTQGQLAEFVPGPVTQVGKVRQILPDSITVRLWTGYFSVVAPIRINWQERKLELGQHCMYQTGHGFAEDGCEMPVLDTPQLAMDQNMTFVRLFNESNDRTGPPAHVVVKKDSKVEILAAKTQLAWQEDKDVIGLGCGEDIWIKLRIDGQVGWIHTAEDLSAIGLHQAG
jgi:hypothetical protein